MRVMTVVVLGVLCVAVSACRKKHAPEVFKLEADVDVLVAQQGEDAYESPEMTVVVAALGRIDPAAVEAERARALGDRIARGRAELAQEREAKQRAVLSQKAPPQAAAPVWGLPRNAGPATNYYCEWSTEGGPTGCFSGTFHSVAEAEGACAARPVSVQAAPGEPRRQLKARCLCSDSISTARGGCKPYVPIR